MGKRVVVIGGGVVGLCCAEFLLRDGHEVTVVDRDGPEGDRCSVGNSGLIVPSHFVPLAAPGMVGLGLRMAMNPRSPFRIKPRFDARLFRWARLFMKSASVSRARAAEPILAELSLLSKRLYQGLSGELNLGMEERGLLMVCREERTVHEESAMASRGREYGIESEVVDFAGLKRVDREMSYQAAGGVFFPGDCHLDPVRLLSALRASIEAKGGRLRWNCEVRKLVVESGTLVRLETDAEAVEADVFVLAAGAYSSEMARTIGLDLPMQAGKGYSMTLDAPPRLPSVPSVLVEGRVAVTPLGTRLRVGGTMEIAGNDLSIDPRRIEGIVGSFVRYCPAYSRDDFPMGDAWRGLRPCSPDGLPYLGPFKVVSNLIAATGHAMMGVSLGPATGQFVSDWVSGTSPTVDSALLSPDRF